MKLEKRIFGHPVLLSASAATSSQAKPGLVYNIHQTSSPMISHHVNSPTPTQYDTILLTKPTVTAAAAVPQTAWAPASSAAILTPVINSVYSLSSEHLTSVTVPVSPIFIQISQMSRACRKTRWTRMRTTMKVTSKPKKLVFKRKLKATTPPPWKSPGTRLKKNKLSLITERISGPF